ncbi:gastrula zinc finger protein XlCGF66.1-like [Eleutherodactylus coqui]|uniref:gastrula zinc finger protein XlCGF66.1-like n=1 Tax=Eleutherodactylus coqui TaxID=57060 RepID=UPI00346236B7
MIDSSEMEEDRNKMAESVLHLTLEILFQLTGEDYTVVKTSSDGCRAPVCDRWGRSLSPFTEPPPHPPMHENINVQKILELTQKMTELLTGEVPIRCQDVTVYFSMEEWEYIGGHRDLYKDVMMEDHRPLTSPDGLMERNPPEKCPRRLYSLDWPEEKLSVPENQQVCLRENTSDTWTGESFGDWGVWLWIRQETGPKSFCIRMKICPILMLQRGM